MKILVIGSGAREHAICVRLLASNGVTAVHASPGNAGIAEIAQVHPISVTDVPGLVGLAQREKIELVVVGPEAALAVGIVDELTRAGIPAVGPMQAAAKIESSKAFAKEIMEAAKVPTARFKLLPSRKDAAEYVALHGLPAVLKADGLASGKGVFVLTENDQIDSALEALFPNDAPGTVVGEEFLPGVEVSCIFATNGSHVVPLLPAHDYKRVGDNDTGLNTGGMGAVCPSPRISDRTLAWVAEHVAQPVVAEMAKRKTPFRGFLYAGLMLSNAKGAEESNVRVLEFNARLGDPECQAILEQLEGGFLELLHWIAGTRKELPSLTWKSGCAVCVVIASKGYPTSPESGAVITGLDLAALVPGVRILHAGTARAGGSITTTGGRTLSLVGSGRTAEDARQTAYRAADIVQLSGSVMRRDIGRNDEAN